MIKIVATIHNAGMAANVGGGVESYSEIIEVPTKNIPQSLQGYIERRHKAKIKNYHTYEALTLSLLEDEI